HHRKHRLPRHTPIAHLHPRLHPPRQIHVHARPEPDDPIPLPGPQHHPLLHAAHDPPRDQPRDLHAHERPPIPHPPHHRVPLVPLARLVERRFEEPPRPVRDLLPPPRRRRAVHVHVEHVHEHAHARQPAPLLIAQPQLLRRQRRPDEADHPVRRAHHRRH